MVIRIVWDCQITSKALNKAVAVAGPYSGVRDGFVAQLSDIEKHILDLKKDIALNLSLKDFQFIVIKKIVIEPEYKERI